MLPMTIIIPAYQAAATLARALDSCVSQREAAQIIVVDDGSTDDSVGLVQGYAQRDGRVCLLRMPGNGGSARARNWASLHASQAVLAFIDADDEYVPGALTAASNYLEQNPNEASVRFDVDFSDFPQDIIRHPDFQTHAATLSNTVPSSLVIRRAVFGALGGFPMNDFFRRLGGYDGAFSWALATLFGNPRLIDAKRVHMHYHPGVHAEKFFRVSMGMQAPAQDEVAEAVRLSRQFVVQAQAAIAQLRATPASTAAAASADAAPVASRSS